VHALQEAQDRPALFKQHLREVALAIGFDDVGIACADVLPHGDFLEQWLGVGRGGDLAYLRHGPRDQPQALLSGARTLIVAAARYPRSGPEHKAIAAYAQREDYHRVLRSGLDTLAELLQAVAPDSRTRVLVDTAPLLEREAAQRAGLGWIGKSTMLVHRGLGCHTLLGELLWTEEIEPDPTEVDHCGTCTRCIDACPTGALDVPYQIDARRCLSYYSIELHGRIPPEYRDAIGTRAFGCDDCIDACPFGAGSASSPAALLPTHETLARASLEELLDRALESFHKHFAWSPVERTRKLGLLRALMVAIGNHGDPALIERVRPFADHPDSHLREQARWALTRLRGSTSS